MKPRAGAWGNVHNVHQQRETSRDYHHRSRPLQRNTPHLLDDIYRQVSADGINVILVPDVMEEALLRRVRRGCRYARLDRDDAIPRRGEAVCVSARRTVHRGVVDAPPASAKTVPDGSPFLPGQVNVITASVTSHERASALLWKLIV